jgi:hypothetical protein
MNVKSSAGQWIEVRKETETTGPHGSPRIHMVEVRQYANCFSRKLRGVQRWSALWG